MEGDNPERLSVNEVGSNKDEQKREQNILIQNELLGGRNIDEFNRLKTMSACELAAEIGCDETLHLFDLVLGPE